MHWSRRSFVKKALATGGGLWLPRRGMALPAGESERKFLFVFCPGGWDQTMVFAPAFGSSIIETEDDISLADANGISFVHSAGRPAVAEFFTEWGAEACLINGFESRSVAHDVCLRLAMTGTTQPDGDDWPAIIASRGDGGLLMPLVHLSGPSYTFEHGEAVVRVGGSGQLPALLDGSALEFSDMAVTLPGATVQALEDEAVVTQAEIRSAAAERGFEQSILSEALATELRLEELKDLADGLDLGSGETLVERAQILIDCFSSGVSRCGMLAYDGIMDLGWDTHAANHVQSLHFDGLFGALTQVMRILEETSGPSGAPLIEEVTVVVMSEMGRYPQYNTRGGREHWTFTSALLVGSGIRGGQVIGGYDDYAAGQPIDLETGALDSAGEYLVTGHVGATLLRLAGLDPAEFISSADPILAALEDE